MSNQWKVLQGDQDARISWQSFKALILTMQKNIKKNMKLEILYLTKKVHNFQKIKHL